MSDDVGWIPALLATVLGSNALTAWLSARMTRSRTRAETSQIISATYDKLIDQLTHQLNDALTRISELESQVHTAQEQERALALRVAQLERVLVVSGMDLPPPLT